MSEHVPSAGEGAEERQEERRRQSALARSGLHGTPEVYSVFLTKHNTLYSALLAKGTLCRMVVC
jgi:hypothetical protein